MKGAVVLVVGALLIAGAALIAVLIPAMTKQQEITALAIGCLGLFAFFAGLEELL